MESAQEFFEYSGAYTCLCKIVVIADELHLMAVHAIVFKQVDEGKFRACYSA